MPPPLPPKTSPMPPTIPSLGAAVGGGQHQFVVRYYRRMKPQRVYRLVVELRSLAKKGAAGTAPTGDPVQLRPRIPGCLVSPAELEITPKGMTSQATFHVTPLAKGRLRDAQVGVYHQGRLLQDVPLRMKGTTQCLTRWLLLLAVAAPLFVWWALSYLDLSSMGPVEPANGAAEVKKSDDTALAADAKEPAEGEPKEAKPATKKVHRPLAVGIVRLVPEYPGETYTRQAALKAQEGYDVLRSMQQKDYLSFWVFAAFLGLALISLVTHRQARGTRKGKPLALPAPATTPDFGGSDALSFNIPVAPMR